MRNPAGTLFRSNETKYRHLAIAQDIEAGWKVAITSKFPHREGSDRLTGIDLARQHRLNRAH